MFISVQKLFIVFSFNKSVGHITNALDNMQFNVYMLRALVLRLLLLLVILHDADARCALVHCALYTVH